MSEPLIGCRGIYVDHSERWPEHFRGMGMRIEDSVCIQDDHPLVFSSEAVKEVSCLQYYGCISVEDANSVQVVDIEALRR